MTAFVFVYIAAWLSHRGGRRAGELKAGRLTSDCNLSSFLPAAPFGADRRLGRCHGGVCCSLFNSSAAAAAAVVAESRKLLLRQCGACTAFLKTTHTPQAV